MTDRRTPAQIAGLIHSPKTEHEEMLEEMATTIRGPDGLTFMERKAAEKLAQRRRLLAEAAALAEQNVKAAEEIERRRSKVMERLTKAEREWRAAQVEASGLPLWAPESPRIPEIHRELIETCDPRLRELQAWLEREIDVTRAYGPPFHLGEIREDVWSFRGNAGFNRDVLTELERRIAAIIEAQAAVRSAMLEALTETEVEAAVAGILAMVPPLSSGASQIGPIPAPLTSAGRLDPHLQVRETKIAAVGERYKRAAKTSQRTRR